MKNNYLILLFFLIAVFQLNAQQFAAPVTNPFGLSDAGSWNRPVFADVDDNFDLDVLSGVEIGDLYYYQNTGDTASPAFSLTPTVNQFGFNDSGFGVSPAIGDIDNDGDYDLFVGMVLVGSGTTHGIYFYENTGSAITPAWANPILDTFGIDSEDTSNVVRYTPTLADLDGDGDLDLLVGRSDGDFLYFANTGTTTSPSFAAAQVNPFGLSDIGDVSTPNLGDVDNDGDLDMISGADNGSFYYFENTGTVSAPSFSAAVVNPFGLSDVGDKSAPFLVDLDADGDLDVMAGAFDGNFYYFENDPTLSTNLLEENNLLSIYPNPVSEELNIELLTSTNYQIRITDLTGREIYSEFVQNDNNLQLSTQAWPAGLYLLQVRDEEGRVETKKIVKQ